MVRETWALDGLYDDRWSGRRVTYTRFHCVGGRLETAMQRDTRVSRRPQTVVAYTGGARVAAATVAPFATETLLLPLSLDGSGRCLARFELGRTGVPSVVEAEHVEGRAVGVRFVRFRYLAP
jgi:hypothetical protein